MCTGLPLIATMDLPLVYIDKNLTSDLCIGVMNSSTQEDFFYANISVAETAVIAALLATVFVVSLLTNSLVLVVFWKRKLLTISNRFVANITVCNYLTTLLIIPVAFTSLLVKQWVFGEFWCVCTGFTMNVLVSANIFTLAVISADRYCAVVTALHYSMRMTHRRCLVFIVCIWLTAVSISAPPLFGWNSIAFQPEKMTCTVTWSSGGPFDSCYTFFLISFSYLLPLLAISWTYFRIFRAAHGNIVRTRRNSIIRASGPAHHSEDTAHPWTPVSFRRRSSSVPILRRLSQTSSRSPSVLWKKEEWKAAVTSFLVLFSFALCWTPNFVVMAAEAGSSDLAARSVHPMVSHVSTVLAMFSCVCNPLVYVFRSKAVRKELALIFRGQISFDSELVIAVPHDIPRRLSALRNDSGHSLPSLAGVVEENEERDMTRQSQSDLSQKNTDLNICITTATADCV